MWTTDRLIGLALEEDLGRGDVTAEAIFSNTAQSHATVVAKEKLTVCGLLVMGDVFKRVDPKIEFTTRVGEGVEVEAGVVVAEVNGSTRSLLGAERTALNFLQRLSGIATLTHAYTRAIEGTRSKVCDTRKTIPGWRTLDKMAVRVGGGANHRIDLAAGVLIKDNHLVATGGIKEAIASARAAAPHTLRIEVEVTRLDQIEEALAERADIVLLDNMSPEMVAAAVSQISGRAIVEVSGGVNLQTIRSYAAAGPDFISVGALTHSARAVDLSLEFLPQ